MAKTYKSSVLFRNPQGKFGLQMRDGTPGIPNRLIWSAFGGGGEPGETPAETARREAKEELGVEASVDEFKHHGSFDLSPDITLHVFELTRPLEWGEFVVNEGAGAGFFTKEEILEMHSSELIRRILKEFF